MTRRLPGAIVASSVLSVVVAALLLVVGVLLARPILRDATLRTVLSSVDLDTCAADPASWGSRSGAFSLFAYDTSGHSKNPHAPPIEADLLAQALHDERVARGIDDASNTIAIIPMTPDGPCAVLRTTGRSIDPQAMRSLLGVLLISTVAGMLLSGAGTFWFVVLPLRGRVEVLSQAARGVGSESFTEPEQDEDALGHIAEVLSKSHRRIVESRQTLMERNQALEDHMAGIAHDLRTPLASMQLALESLAAEADGPLQAESRRALADVVYLSALVENLHHGTRLRHDVNVTDGAVDLAEVVRRLEKRFAIVGRYVGVKVASSVPEGNVWAKCTPSLAERAVANLIQNAIEHNPGQGHVALILTRSNDDRFELVVVDDGPGLPDGILASLEAESFLLDGARQRSPGIGMMITAEIARRAGWTLTYEAMADHGLKVTITGPVASTP